MLLDSRLVVGQVEGELEARDSRMREYLSQVRHLRLEFKSFTLQQIPRSRNTHSDSLATLATSSAQGSPRVILVEDLCISIEVKKDVVQVHQIRVGPSWMDPIVMFIKDDILLEEKGKIDKVRRKAPRFWLFEDKKLYKRSFSGPYLLCIHSEAVEPLLEELYEGICGSHISGRSLSHRALTQGYWSLGIQREAREYVKKYDQCQRFALNIHQPSGILNHLFSPWPFAQWGLDIVGPFPKAAGNRKWLLVGTNYLTKWVEAESLANIRDIDAKRFGNGQAKAVNKVTVNGLKKMLDDAKGKWVEELPHLAYYQQKLKQRYDSNVKLRLVAPGDLVLRKVFGTAKNPAWGKLEPNWEGLYCITSVAGIGA
ncbi:uncharacterized protein LOC142639643 [Castanea sativa]|uniref:uncharacterized protein LOC142639643 n=1 Tax=Castanea sativa TaxID=21020 RepID=UPI003F64F9F8